MKTGMKTRAAAMVLWFAASAALLSAQQPADTQMTNMPMPAVIHQLPAHIVVERIIGWRHELFLSDQQFDELVTLHSAVHSEMAIYESTGRTKPPFKRPVWITTPEQALAQSFTILTPQQQHQLLMLFEKEGHK